MLRAALFVALMFILTLALSLLTNVLLQTNPLLSILTILGGMLAALLALDYLDAKLPR